MRGDTLPMPQISVDHPVDQLADLPLDLLRRVCHDLPLERFLHAAAVQQIHHAADAHRVVEEMIAAALHLEQHVLDVGHPQLEVALHVALIQAELALHLLEGRDIVFEQRLAIAKRACADVRRQPSRHPAGSAA